MSDRRRFLLIVILLAVALGVGSWVTVEGIEAKLLARAQLALAAAGIPLYDIEIVGRDAVLRGLVPSSERERQIVELVSAVPGMRSVASELVIERVVEGADRPLIAPAGAPPSLRLQRSGNAIRLSGRVPSAAHAAALVEAVRAALPRTDVTGGIASSAGTASADWLLDPAGVGALLAASGGDVRLLIQGSTAVLSGTVRDAATAERAMAAAHGIRGLQWDFELYVLDGTFVSNGGAA